MHQHRYKAFISYSHADEKDGQWLQRQLEAFRTPASLIGRDSIHGPAPERLSPIFRDREDFPAAGNLNDEIQQALSESHFQVVLCSPRAAASKWVNEEIKLFKKLHGAGRTLAIIIDGEPGGGPGRECFPEALRFVVNENGEITDEAAEPVAADARDEGDGRRSAILKIAAGMLGVKLDDLVQRDAARRARRARLMVAMSAGLTAIFGVMAFYANEQRREAVVQRNQAHIARGEAEDLIEFMLTDFRGTLEPIGRLDALEAVGDRALEYYGRQDAVDDDALGRRARALSLVGQIDFKRSDFPAAQAAFDSAAMATEELLRRAPNDEQRIFDHAQSVFWLGRVPLERNDYATARAHFLEYLRLAEHLVAINPVNPDWKLEIAYATNTLGGLQHRSGNFDEAAEFFKQSVEVRRSLVDLYPANKRYRLSVANALSWVAISQIAQGDYLSATGVLNEEISVYEKITTGGGEDYENLHLKIAAQRRLSNVYLSTGSFADAMAIVEEATSRSEKLILREPSNTIWKRNAAYTHFLRSEIHHYDGLKSSAIKAAKQSVAYAKEVYENDSNHSGSIIVYAYSLSNLVLRGEASDDQISELRKLHRPLISLQSKTSLEAIAARAIALSSAFKRAGQNLSAREVISDAIIQLQPKEGEMSISSKLRLFELYRLSDRHDLQARQLQDEFERIGLQHPRFVRNKIDEA